MKRNIIVIGASTGGVKALKELVASFSPEMDASVFIVWHMPEYAEGLLPRLLEGYSHWPAVNAVDGEPIETKKIYVAPPDHHLILEPGRMRTTKGPKENRYRPSVDPLFRSAAQAYGPRETAGRTQKRADSVRELIMENELVTADKLRSDEEDAQ